MYEFITFELKCPVCDHSLMDEKNQVDNNPSIKLNLEIDNKKGTIFLSSVYSSYNYVCNVKVPQDKIAVFSCPHCASKLVSNKNCEECEAPMIPFNLKMGGRVSICSRSGCKNHFVEFSDLEIALKNIYQEYGFRGRSYPGKPPEFDQIDLKKHKDEEKEIIETGAFLQSYCPHCKKSLIENNQLKLKVVNGKTGYLYLSPYLNVFTSKSTIFLHEKETCKDMICPHCDKSLIIKDKECDKCGSPVTKILISAHSKMIDFYVCTKKGCKWHGLNNDDYNDIMLEDSLEW
ncbi:MAG: hypothetical protein GXO79_12575 [Chlorobi bacterium]|nr:hypothetical protein [Chlorobiota bacterium]